LDCPNFLRSPPNVSPIGYGHSGDLDKLRDLALATEQNVINDLFGRRDLAVGVMPSKFSEFQQVKNWIGKSIAKNGNNAIFPNCSSLGLTNCHLCLAQ
jgi:hypothetical protein